MMMLRCFAALTFLMLRSPAWADDSADRAKLMGKWRLEQKASNGPATSWTLELKGEGVIHVTRIEGDRTIADFECGLGRECEVKDSGRKVKVSWYFNGPKLVELETSGSDVTKRRFGLASPGDAMELEVMPLVPSGKNETLHFQRTELASASK
jgi:hypothetical protein